MKRYSSSVLWFVAGWMTAVVAPAFAANQVSAGDGSLRFEPNRGRTSDSVRYLARGVGTIPQFKPGSG